MAIHKEHDDRYFNLQGEVEVILYDVRPDSVTCGQLSRIRLSEFDRCLFSIPRLVWHTRRNLGHKDFIGVNFPTVPYDHANPDKSRLPQIPTAARHAADPVFLRGHPRLVTSG